MATRSSLGFSPRISKEVREMKNNNGKGLYEVGERAYLSCGCIIVAEKTGYTHLVHSNCDRDNRYHSEIPHYKYQHQEA